MNWKLGLALGIAYATGPAMADETLEQKSHRLEKEFEATKALMASETVDQLIQRFETELPANATLLKRLGESFAREDLSNPNSVPAVFLQLGADTFQAVDRAQALLEAARGAERETMKALAERDPKLGQDMERWEKQKTELQNKVKVLKEYQKLVEARRKEKIDPRLGELLKKMTNDAKKAELQKQDLETQLQKRLSKIGKDVPEKLEKIKQLQKKAEALQGQLKGSMKEPGLLKYKEEIHKMMSPFMPPEMRHKDAPKIRKPTPPNHGPLAGTSYPAVRNSLATLIRQHGR